MPPSALTRPAWLLCCRRRSTASEKVTSSRRSAARWTRSFKSSSVWTTAWRGPPPTGQHPDGFSPCQLGWDGIVLVAGDVDRRSGVPLTIDLWVRPGFVSECSELLRKEGRREGNRPGQLSSARGAICAAPSPHVDVAVPVPVTPHSRPRPRVLLKICNTDLPSCGGITLRE